MAYFSNGSEGSCFEEECSKCKYGNDPCPISEVQFVYNYDAANNEVATCILGALVKDDGACTMLQRFPELRTDRCGLCEYYDTEKKVLGIECYDCSRNYSDKFTIRGEQK
jgi:hypothetical protein